VKLLDIYTQLEQPSRSIENPQTKNQKKAQPKLSMIWVKEFDGKHHQLVARWIVQN
jgi:hypothetical protein